MQKKRDFRRKYNHFMYIVEKVRSCCSLCQKGTEAKFTFYEKYGSLVHFLEQVRRNGSLFLQDRTEKWFTF